MLNYIGPGDGQGIRIYLNGALKGSDDTKEEVTTSPGYGRVVVGRYSTDQDDKYASADFDELLFFNDKLNDQQVMTIGN